MTAAGEMAELRFDGPFPFAVGELAAGVAETPEERDRRRLETAQGGAERTDLCGRCEAVRADAALNSEGLWRRRRRENEDGVPEDGRQGAVLGDQAKPCDGR